MCISLLCRDSGTVCKPLIPAEYDFYCNIETESPALIPYVPKYYGIMSIDKTVVNESANDQFELYVNDNATCQIDSKQHNNDDITASSRPHSADDSTLPDTPYNDNNNPTHSAPLSNDDNFTYNRWAYKCLQQKIKKDKQKQHKQSSSLSNTTQTPQSTHRQYIVLEDLTFAYSKPSILDLKLGTRQHGEYDSPAKIQSKMQRCASTTSGSIGLRLCGMQVYKPAQQRNIYRDKYYGRTLNIHTFKQSLREYFWNGQQYRVDVMYAFIQRLTEVRQALIDEPQYRFYSSSLLLVYEGQDDNSPSSGSPSISPILTATQNNTNNNIVHTQLHTIDLNDTTMTVSSHDNTLMPPPSTTINKSNPSQSSSLSHSQSMPISLQQPIDTTNKTQHNHNISNQSNLSHNSNKPLSSIASQTLTNIAYGTYPFVHNRPPPKIYARKRKTTHAQAKERARLRGGIDVRIIDFAHTTKVTDHSTSQDSGLILGFTNLIEYIRELLDIAERQHKRSSSDVSSYIQTQRIRQSSHHDLNTIDESNDDYHDTSNDSKLSHSPDSHRQLFRSESDVTLTHTPINNNTLYNEQHQHELHA